MSKISLPAFTTANRPVLAGTLCAFVLYLCASSAWAHEHWIDTDDFYPGTGTSVNVRVCSGHYFPKSSFAVKDKVLQGVTVWGPGGEVAVTTAEEEKQRAGILALTSGGVRVVSFSLGRPRAKAPSYEGKALVVVGNTGDDPSRYALGTGLELVPAKPVSELRPGVELPISLCLNGTPLRGTLSVSAEGGKTSSLRTEPDRAATIKLRKGGRYLVTARHEGRGCSLMFMVMEAEKSEVGGAPLRRAHGQGGQAEVAER